MSKTDKLTENQREATYRDANIIVSAGAGSGKTFTMISRIVDKIKRGVPLEQMLIVTFTRSAAADMRFKLAKRLSELKKEGGGRAINDAVDAMSVCNIGTLHSYCQRLIRSYFYAAKLDPSATLCEDGEAGLMKRAAVDAAIEHALTSKTPSAFLQMYDMLSTRKSDDGVVEILLEIMEFALSTPDPDGYLNAVKPDEEFFYLIDAAFAPRRQALVFELDNIIKDLAAAGMNSQADAATALKEYVNGMPIDVPKSTHKKKHDYRDTLNDRFLKIKKRCTDLVKARGEAETAKLRSGYESAKALCEVAADALNRYAAAKARQGKIDYSDLEHGALRVLRDETCMEEIARGIKYVFIDEFQDVNPLQSEIAETFRAAGAQMFVVGDVKQSIYGFRRCSPVHFITTIKSAVPVAELRSGAVRESELNGRYVHIPLTDNFRSDKSVIDFINGVFDGVMTEDFGGADYKNSDRLVCGKKTSPDKVTGAEFVLIEGVEQTSGSDEIYSVRSSAARAAKPDSEAVFIADAIAKWLEQSTELYESLKIIYDEERAAYEAEKRDFDAGLINKEPQKPTPPEAPTLGEVAVLMRSLDPVFCASLGQELDKRNIAYDFGRKSSVKTYPAAVMLVDILRYVDNRYDDVALYTALRSPMGGFSDEQLVKIARDGAAAYAAKGYGEARSFWQKLDAYDGEYNDKLDAFMSLRDDVALQAKKLDSGDVLGYVTAKTDYFQYVYESGGDARAVEALIEYAAERRLDVHGFLSFYDSADFDLNIESGGDAVTITTEHSSKGLEYDLVIVANTGKRFNTTDTTRRVLITENGVAVKIPDKPGSEPVATVPWIVENGFAPHKLRQEELRMFYVALTRAKNRLIVCGKAKSIQEFDDNPTPPVGASCQRDFMCGRRHLPPHTPNPIGDNAVQPLPADKAIVDAVREVCGAKIEHTAQAIKTCVTELAHAAFFESEDGEQDYTSGAVVIVDESSHGKRNFGKGKKQTVDPRIRGTAYHRAMELIDFDEPDLDAVAADCENFDCVDGKDILAAAKVMRELTKSAVKCFRERYFIVDMPTRYISSGVDGQNILVQGVIDFMAVNANGEVTLVDYKTGDPATLVNDGYKTQLRLYAHAVEIATCGKYRVRSAYLYSFDGGKLIPIDIA